MKRNYTAYRIVQAFLFALLLMLLSVSVLAQDTTLTTTVPNGHTLHIELEGKGTVTIDGVSFAKSAEAQIPRHEASAITLQPADGFKIKAVLWGGEDVTSAAKNGTWTAPQISEDTVLTVSFEKSPYPVTGDSRGRQIPMLGVLLLSSLAGILLCTVRKKAHTV